MASYNLDACIETIFKVSNYCKTLCPDSLNDRDFFNFDWVLDKGYRCFGILIYLFLFKLMNFLVKEMFS